MQSEAGENLVAVDKIAKLFISIAFPLVKVMTLTVYQIVTVILKHAIINVISRAFSAIFLDPSHFCFNHWTLR